MRTAVKRWGAFFQNLCSIHQAIGGQIEKREGLRKLYVVLVMGLAIVAALLGVAAPSKSQAVRSYVVVYDLTASTAAARSAVGAAGGTIIEENLKVGVATAVSKNPNFVRDAIRWRALMGAARDRPIGHTLRTPPQADRELAAARAAARGTLWATRRFDSRRSAEPLAEPLADRQWNMRMINATPEGSYARERGKGVTVGIMDTGIDGRHPDIAPNFSRRLSRNFTTDIPLVDGPCEDEPDRSCSDPADVDENSHGTHVAGIVGAAINRLGVAGVAPEVTLVNLRAGQDSGFFFLMPTVNAFVYAGDRRIDVVNMSFFTDPWLYNCSNHPADSPAEQQEQRTIIEATQRAVDYANRRGVILVAASGNSHEDLGAPTKIDTTSPDYPPGNEKLRIVDNRCLDLPTEANHVMSINALGPTTRKADYSNYGVEQSTVAAPGGWFRDDPWRLTDPPDVRTANGIPNLILSPYPENVAREFGEINPDGTPNTPFVLRDCLGSTCAYYQYLQGTSMASPHVAGVLALIVAAARGDDDRLSPRAAQRILEQTATNHACPEPRLHSYADKGRDWSNFCAGTPEFNGFYGHGIANALAAVQRAGGQTTTSTPR